MIECTDLISLRIWFGKYPGRILGEPIAIQNEGGDRLGARFN